MPTNCGNIVDLLDHVLIGLVLFSLNDPELFY